LPEDRQTYVAEVPEQIAAAGSDLFIVQCQTSTVRLCLKGWGWPSVV